jgi:hypothetical protein
VVRNGSNWRRGGLGHTANIRLNQVVCRGRRCRVIEPNRRERLGLLPQVDVRRPGVFLQRLHGV